MYVYMVHVYIHIDLVLFVFIKSGAFCMKSGTFHEKHLKSNKKQLIQQISHFDLVFHRVQREGQLSISYILVVFAGALCVNGAYIHTY